MYITITQWALDSYLNLKSEHIFTNEEYQMIIKPDVMLLKVFPTHLKFSQSKFWSVAQGIGGKAISDGFKMKWHQVGSGRVQLRLTVGIFKDECLLCEAYVKSNDKQDKRELARFKTYLELIRRNKYTIRGRLV